MILNKDNLLGSKPSRRVCDVCGIEQDTTFYSYEICRPVFECVTCHNINNGLLRGGEEVILLKNLKSLYSRRIYNARDDRGCLTRKNRVSLTKIEGWIRWLDAMILEAETEDKKRGL